MAFTATHVILIIAAVILPVAVAIFSMFFVRYFRHENDKGWTVAVVPKIIVIAILSLALLSMIILPLDIANAKASSSFGKLYDGDMDFVMGIIWQVFYGVVILVVIIVVPFAVFYYESEDPDKGICHQVMWASIITAIVLVIFIAAFCVFYFTCSTAEVPFTAYKTYEAFPNITSAINYDFDLSSKVEQMETQMEIKWVSVVVMAIAVLNLVGWIVFIVLGGCGLTALPLELIKAFIFRPVRMKSEEFMAAKEQMQKKAEKMIELGQQIQEKRNNGEITSRNIKHVRLMNDFKQAALKLEHDWRIIHKRFYAAGGSVIVPWLQLIAGIIAAILSLVWILHIILWMVLPEGWKVSFLNVVFDWFDSAISDGFPFLGAILYGIFAYYMLFCVIAGAMRIGAKTPIISTFIVHPLIPGETMMNSLLFNAALFLVSSITVNQFVTDAFSGYASSTAISGLFVDVIKNLKGIKYFFTVVIYILLGFAGLGFIASFIFIRDKSPEEKDFEKALQNVFAEMK